MHLFVGNPGVGKSTLINSIVQKAVCKGGVSIKGGLTKTLKKYVDEKTGQVYMDTPGLDDAERREHAAEEITQALKEDGQYKIFFVLTVEAGRIRPGDLKTMELITGSCKDITKYHIIYNKLSEIVKKKLMANRETLDTYDRRLGNVWFQI